MRMSLYPPIFMTGIDMHGKLPPMYLPPVPPLPPDPALRPKQPWLVLGTNVMATIFGKYTLVKSQTDHKGEILWQYDRGPLQAHVPIMPPFVSPSIATLAATSSSKFWMPSFQVQHVPEGGAIAMASASATPIAISTAAYMISVQNCWDIGCAKSFVVPSGVSFQNPSTRYVNFNFGDFMAGLIGMAADALSALVLSYFGGKLFKGTWDNFIFGACANLFSGFVASLSWAPLAGVPVVGGALLFAKRWLMNPGGAGREKGAWGLGALAIVVSYVGSLVANGVGNAWGSPNENAPAPAPAAVAPPSAQPSLPPPQTPLPKPAGPPDPQNSTPAPPPPDPAGPPNRPPAGPPNVPQNSTPAPPPDNFTPATPAPSTTDPNDPPTSTQ